MDARVRVEVAPGFFSTERSVEFSVGDRFYSLIVDHSELEGDLLHVYVLGERGAESMIELPGETINHGRRIVATTALLLPS